MQAGIHAVGWGLSRLAFVGLAIVLLVVMAYVGLVFVQVAIQAAGALSQ